MVPRKCRCEQGKVCALGQRTRGINYITPSLQADNPYIFHSPGNGIFPRKKKPKIFDFENVMERGIRKIFIFVEL